ncbi:glycosyltransferase (plasmid) [Skermanella sp. TT6]|uniref:Glycosyltransferase n=1 Tax=Skermanella cutis TaxID=2775420 RepID=A0ABX7BEE2_9PROT|nr:glycosyltransferase [Skermanella sp. TT6]QQP92773.1 glycosyltransferase [Skermanella sp. TT6]
MKVLLVAFSARFALEHYIDGFASALADRVALKVMVPDHYAGGLDSELLVRVPCGTSKGQQMAAAFSPVTYWRIARSVLQEAPDVIHIISGEGYPWVLPVMMVARWRSSAVLVTVHDAEAHPGSFIERLNCALRRPVLNQATALHVHTQESAALVQRSFPGARIGVIPHGSFAERFTIHDDPTIAPERLVLFFGRIAAYKGIDILCEAMRRLPGDIRLAICGPGTLPEAEAALVRELGDRVILENRFLDESEVACWMRRAAVVALPYTHVTASSLPAITAAFGRRIVASRLGSFRDEIEENGGILVPPGNPDALAIALTEAMVMGDTPITRASTFTELAPKFIELYSRAFDRHDGTSEVKFSGAGIDV